MLLANLSEKDQAGGRAGGFVFERIPSVVTRHLILMVIFSSSRSRDQELMVIFSFRS